MSKQEKLRVTGTVVETHPNAQFTVDIGPSTVLAYLSGKVRRERWLRIVLGDEVIVELSPYDLTRGRIVWRNK